MLPHVFPAGLVNGGLGVCKRCAGVLGGAVHLHENADEVSIIWTVCAQLVDVECGGSTLYQLLSSYPSLVAPSSHSEEYVVILVVFFTWH